MAEDGDAENELLDYEEEENEAPAEGAQAVKDQAKKDVKGTYVSIHSSGFRDFLLKPELLRAIVDCGFEHPSEGKKKKTILFIATSLFFDVFKHPRYGSKLVSYLTEFPLFWNEICPYIWHSNKS